MQKEKQFSFNSYRQNVQQENDYVLSNLNRILKGKIQEQNYKPHELPFDETNAEEVIIAQHNLCLVRDHTFGTVNEENKTKKHHILKPMDVYTLEYCKLSSNPEYKAKEWDVLMSVWLGNSNPLEIPAKVIQSGAEAVLKYAKTEMLKQIMSMAIAYRENNYISSIESSRQGDKPQRLTSNMTYQEYFEENYGYSEYTYPLIVALAEGNIPNLTIPTLPKKDIENLLKSINKAYSMPQATEITNTQITDNKGEQQ